MVEMIQRIFRSLEHNNLGALYPHPEGTGFTARVITVSLAVISVARHFVRVYADNFARIDGK